MRTPTLAPYTGAVNIITRWNGGVLNTADKWPWLAQAPPLWAFDAPTALLIARQALAGDYPQLDRSDASALYVAARLAHSTRPRIVLPPRHTLTRWQLLDLQRLATGHPTARLPVIDLATPRGRRRHALLTAHTTGRAIYWSLRDIPSALSARLPRPHRPPTR